MEHKLITSKKARELCGGITSMTEWRWRQDEKLKFPQPVTIRGRNFYREAEILAWIEWVKEQAGVARGAA